MADEQQRIDLLFDDSDEYCPEPLPAPETPAWKDGSRRIGIHTSIAGDITASLEIAHALGANALQIFSASPRMWTRGASRISEADSTRFRARRRELRLGPLAIHDNYLINLASPNPVLRARSVQTFHHEIVRAMALGADYLVFHPGCCGADRGVDQAISAIAQGLRQAVRGLQLGDLQLLLENMAGQGTSVGSTFGELKAIIDASGGVPLGVCVDTAHLYAAGWDIRTEAGLDKALLDIDSTVGLDRVRLLHVNDSKMPLGSRVDRHEHIGKGRIGLEALGRVLNHPLLAGRAFIAETPIDKPGDDRKNVSALWKLIGRGVVASGQDGMKPRKKPVKLKVSGVRRKAKLSRAKSSK